MLLGRMGALLQGEALMLESDIAADRTYLLCSLKPETGLLAC